MNSDNFDLVIVGGGPAGLWGLTTEMLNDEFTRSCREGPDGR